MPKMLTAWTPVNPRTDVVWVGGLFRASLDQLVFALGLYVYPGNSGPADVYLVDQITGNILAQVSVNMSGAQSPLGFVYASLSSPVTMISGRAYALSAYSAQMAQWSNSGPISTTTDFAAVDQCYSTGGPGGIYVDYGKPGFMYVGLDLIYGAPASPPNIWTPNLVADIVLEADSLAGRADGSTILSWPGTGKNLSYSGVAVAASAPAYKANLLNGFPAIRFNAAQLVKVTSIVQTGGMTMALVGRFNALAFYGMLMIYYDSAVNDWELRANGNSTGLQYICDGGTYSVSGYDMTFNWHILVGVYNRSSGLGSLYIDGAQYGSSGLVGTAPMSGQSLWLGQRSDGYAFDGDLAASIMVIADLSVADRQNIEGYLANKYGLTANLPANHPYKNSPPVLPARAGASVLMVGL